MEIGEHPELGFEGSVNICSTGILSRTYYSQSRQNAVGVGKDNQTLRLFHEEMDSVDLAYTMIYNKMTELGI